MSKLKDLCGNRYGRLIVIKRVADYISPKGKKYVRWECLCDCGKTTVVDVCNLTSGRTRSCGCLEEDSRTTNNRTHGHAGTRLYKIYYNARTRCYNEKHNRSHCYEDVTMCDEWMRSFESFAKWAYSNGYSDNLTLDRIDVYGNYEPSNCRWATPKQQANNKRNNRRVEYSGEMKTVSEICDITGLKRSVLDYRLKQGLPHEYLFLPPHRGKSYVKQGNAEGVSYG